jgi:DNA-binding NarL/FixJ family response regulator
MKTSAAQAAPRIRVVIADDHSGVRSGLQRLLDCAADIEVIGAAADGREAIALATTLAPDVILMDIGMPVMDGLEATRRLTRADVRARIIVLTASADPPEVALRAGAAAHLTKDSAPDELVSCIRSIAAG